MEEVDAIMSTDVAGTEDGEEPWTGSTAPPTDAELIEIFEPEEDSWLRNSPEGAGLRIFSAEQFDEGLTKLSKESLINVPFLVMDIKDHPGLGEQPFWYLEVLTKDGRRGYITDGGQGIGPVVDKFCTQTGQTRGLLCPRGLTVSHYVSKATGQPAQTYRIG